jgi:uncharacterized membrane protein (UPF0127 family)
MFNKKMLLAGLLLCLFISCGEKLDTIEIYIKGNRFIVECARTDEERRKGLMFRKELPPKKGMVFVFPQYGESPFWMKSTYIPLSIAFLSEDGEILDIKDMSPLSTDLVKSRYPYKYALEVNQGEFEELGIRPGDYVLFPRDFPDTR